jgi:hypothetical protein
MGTWNKTRSMKMKIKNWTNSSMILCSDEVSGRFRGLNQNLKGAGGIEGILGIPLIFAFRFSTKQGLQSA